MSVAGDDPGGRGDGEERLHCLVVGGTGMLREVCLWLARRGHTVSVVGRRKRRLETLVSRSEGLDGEINPLTVDYRDTEDLRARLAEAAEEHGPFRIAVCWIHSQSPEALSAVAEIVASPDDPCQLVRVRASATADPARPDVLTRSLEKLPGLRYGEVILGFVTEAGQQRWLDDEEISGAVIAAVRAGSKRMVVGEVRRWDRKS